MSALVIVEHNNQQFFAVNRNVMTAALQLSAKPVLLVLGYQCQAVVEEARTLAGVFKVIVLDEPCFEHPVAETMSEAIVNLAEAYSFVLAPSSTFGKNVLPRVAASLDLSQVSDVNRIIDTSTFEHPIYAGNAIETIKLLDEKKILTIRATAFNPVSELQQPCVVEKLAFSTNFKAASFVKQELSQSERPELGSAKIIVSGGRGLQSKEKFKLIEELADCLGAAVGATRAAVDAGFVPNDYQVGQTGKVVAPELYFAIGVSGAIQHLAGMKDSKIIVAINKDADAPIFQIADYGLVGDLFELIPQLIAQLREKR